MKQSIEAIPTRRDLQQRLMWDFFLRFHMILIVLVSFFSGLLTTKWLYRFGVEIMWLRYLLALAVAYSVFLLGVRVWLAYTGHNRYLRQHRDNSSADIPDLSSGGDHGGAASPCEMTPGGGEFGGGGARSIFEIDGASLPDMPGVSLGDTADVLGGAADGEGCLVALVGGILWVAVAAVVLWLFGSGFYVIYEAPAIFTEVVFEAILADRLLRTAKGADAAGWIGGAFRATWKPFARVSAFALLVGVVGQLVYPDAHTLTDIFHHLSS